MSVTGDGKWLASAHSGRSNKRQHPFVGVAWSTEVQPTHSKSERGEHARVEPPVGPTGVRPSARTRTIPASSDVPLMVAASG